MLRIDNLKLPVGVKEDKLRAACAHALRVSEEALVSVKLLRRSIDAREGVKLVCSCAVEVKNESGVLRRCKNKNVQPYAPKKYTPPAPVSAPEVSPVVIGAGPAGLFCALLLARCGARPILLERGRAVEQRKRDVEHFWRTGELDLTSNVQFGEGGAGAFSDGKLNTGTKDLRHGYILEEFVRFGASEDILVDAKPHVGTDKLYVVLQNLRREIIDRGGEVRFSHKVVDIEQNSGSVTALRVSAPEGEYTLPTKHVVLAPGHSARDTFEMLQKRGVPMEPKPFAVGVRIEHRQHDMDAAQYKEAAGRYGLPPTSYKLSCHTEKGRGVFSFCVCPGGEVVAAASEEKRVVTNGMSEFARDGENINGGLLVSVTPEDFPSGDTLAGVAFQRELEARAYAAGRSAGEYAAPAENIQSFLEGRGQLNIGRVQPTYDRGVTAADLGALLPGELADTLRAGLRAYERKIAGYTAPEAILTGLETRTSSPVRLKREENFECSQLAGLYPCGEGAGYAGGIMSAAVDGLRVARAIISRYAPAEG